MLTFEMKRYERGAFPGFTATVVSDRGDLSGDVFVRVPEKSADLLSPHDDALLPYLAFLALVRGEDLEGGGLAVDPILLRNLRAALAQYGAWFPALRPPVLSGFRETSRATDRAAGAASFFSGGIDSQFTLARHSEGRWRTAVSSIDQDVDYALHVYHCADLDEVDGSDSTMAALAANAEALGARFLPIYSNAMTFDRRLHDRWGDVGHGAFLASVLHALSGQVGVGMIGSTHSYGHIQPWGSSPITDPLFSSSRLRVVHDGSTFTRVEKTMIAAESPAVRRAINVCDTRVEGLGYVNCSSCQKCLRTMITLDLAGLSGADACPAFNWSRYRPDQFGQVLLRNDNERAFAQEILDAARADRPDIAAAAARALRRSRYLFPIARIEDAVKTTALGRRFRAPLKRSRDRVYRALNWGK